MPFCRSGVVFYLLNSRAEITGSDTNRIRMDLKMEDPELDNQFEIRFLTQEA